MPSKRVFGMVLATRCLENAFFKDVSNEITTFEAPKSLKSVFKSCTIAASMFGLHKEQGNTLPGTRASPCKTAILD